MTTSGEQNWYKFVDLIASRAEQLKLGAIQIGGFIFQKGVDGYSLRRKDLTEKNWTRIIMDNQGIEKVEIVTISPESYEIWSLFPDRIEHSIRKELDSFPLVTRLWNPQGNLGRFRIDFEPNETCFIAYTLLPKQWRTLSRGEPELETLPKNLEGVDELAGVKVERSINYQERARIILADFEAFMQLLGETKA